MDKDTLKALKIIYRLLVKVSDDAVVAAVWSEDIAEEIENLGKIIDDSKEGIMEYIIVSEDNLIDFVFTVYKNTNRLVGLHVKNFIKSRESVQLVASGKIDNVCSKFGKWACYKDSNQEFNIYVQEVKK